MNQLKMKSNFMKILIHSNWTRLLAVLVVALPLSLSAQGTPPPQVNDNIYNYLQLLRSDFNSTKVDIINRIMKLSEADAKKFWPIYREYDNELARQSINRAELIAQFVQAHEDGTFDNAQAKVMSRKWFKAQRARLDLLEKYHGKIERALTPLQAGQFLQIENQLALFVDITIAGEMPTVGEKSK
jgi:hypothetical protein